MRQRNRKVCSLHQEKKKQEIEAACKSDQMFNLTDNDFKVTIINMFKELKQTIPKDLKDL